MLLSTPVQTSKNDSLTTVSASNFIYITLLSVHRLWQPPQQHRHSNTVTRNQLQYISIKYHGMGLQFFFTVCGSHSSVCAYITRLKREECCWDHGMPAVLPHVIVLTVEFKIHTPLLHINKTTLRITILSHTGSSSCTSVTSRGANGFFLFATNTAQHIHYNKCLA